MTDKEKLIKLLVNNPHLDVLYGEEYTDAADHLLSHGVTVREPGEWIDMQEDDATEGMWRCSVCGDDRYFTDGHPYDDYGAYYCGNCGAPMKGESNA